MSARDGRPGWRRRWPWLVAVGVVVLAAVTGGTVLVRWLLAPEPPSPALPDALATIGTQWSDPLLIPTQLPPCLGYASSGAAVVADNQARGGRAVRIRFAPAAESGCPANVPDPQVVLTEGTALESLSGAVRTVSADRLQLAETAQANAGGGTRVTLQWHCLDMMCRLSGTTSAALPQSDLVAMAASVAVAAR